MSFFNILRERSISRAEEIRILYKNHNTSIEKLTDDLLYDREWCASQGIRYYDLKSPCDNLSALEIAEKFVINAIN